MNETGVSGEIKMSEVQGSPKSGISELEKIFQEYKNKLEHAEQESEQIVSLAWQKAEGIIAETKEKARELAAEVDSGTKQEADKILQEAKAKAERTVKEADERIKKEAKEKIKREIEKILAVTREAAEKEAAEIVAHSRREADQIISEYKESVRSEALMESAAIISEAKESTRKVDEDTIARAAATRELLAGSLQKAEHIFELFKTQVQTGLADLILEIDKARDNIEVRSATDNIHIGAAENAAIIKKAGDNQSFGGRRELNIIPPYDRVQIKRLLELLKQIPSIRLAGEVATESDCSIYIDIVEPVPLLNVLREMSLIASSDVRGDTIKLRLKPSRNGN